MHGDESEWHLIVQLLLQCKASMSVSFQQYMVNRVTSACVEAYQYHVMLLYLHALYEDGVVAEEVLMKQLIKVENMHPSLSIVQELVTKMDDMAYMNAKKQYNDMKKERKVEREQMLTKDPQRAAKMKQMLNAKKNAKRKAKAAIQKKRRLQ